jgi:plastocyanin
MTRPRMIAAALLLAALPLLAAACSEGPNVPLVNESATPPASSGSPAALVTLDYASFEPAIVTIRQGQTVEWQWLDAPIPHDVYFDSFVPASGGAAQSYSAHSAIMLTGTWSQVFNQAGTYYYGCTIHPNMDGEVIVLGS